MPQVFSCTCRAIAKSCRNCRQRNLDEFLNSSRSLKSQDTHFLTPEESAAIDEAIRSLEAGKGIPASEVRQRFAVISSTNSQIALDEPGTEQLVGRGDLLCNNGRGLVRAQSYFIPQPEFLKLCLNNG